MRNLRWLWARMRAYWRPDWHEIECPHCHAIITARSGVHMTAAVGTHSRLSHPVWRIKRGELIFMDVPDLVSAEEKSV